MTHPPPVTPDDPADVLAKEVINRFCTVTNKFVQHRCMHQYTANPLQGLNIPFAPLAQRIRDVAKMLTPVPDIPPPPVSNDWFGDDQPQVPFPAAPEPAPAPAPPVGVGVECEGGGESASLDQIVRAMNGRKMRIADLANELGISRESLAGFIASPHSGLAVSGPGWVQIKA